MMIQFGAYRPSRKTLGMNCEKRTVLANAESFVESKLDLLNTVEQSWQTMLNQSITMPAHLMSDGSDVDMFSCFSRVAQGLGVYTFSDYIEIMVQVIQFWNVPHLRGLSGDAAKAQDKVRRMPAYYRRRSSWMEKRLAAQSKMPFLWLRERASV